MIKGLHVQNFKGFKDLELKDFQGINLFVGVNDTGKTSLMKLMYAMLKAARVEYFQKEKRLDVFRLTEEKLISVFNPRFEGLKELAYETELYFKISIGIDIKHSNHDFDFYSSSVVPKNLSPAGMIGTYMGYGFSQLPKKFDVFFIPSRTIIDIYKPIIYSRINGELKEVDDTMLDIAVTLNSLKSVNATLEEFKDLVNVLVDSYDGIIRYDDFRRDYVFIKNKKEISISLTAEGIRKLGTFVVLLQNRIIKKGDVLFIDEPENNLHPKALRQFMEALVKLSRAGVQIFMASHNYFVLKQLEIIARRDGIDIGCYSLLRNDEGDIYCESGNLRHTMPENEIVDEGAAMFEDGVKVQFENAKKRT